MTKLIERITSCQYYQVCLLDNEVKNGYPQWKTGNEEFVKTKNGIAVSLIKQEKAVIKIFLNEIPVGNVIGETIISIGKKGAICGNIVSADLKQINIAKGEYKIIVSVDRTRELEEVSFYLNKLN